MAARRCPKQPGDACRSERGGTHVSGKMTPKTISIVLESCTKCRRAGAHSQTQNQPTAIKASACTRNTVLVPLQICATHEIRAAHACAMSARSARRRLPAARSWLGLRVVRQPGAVRTRLHAVVVPDVLERRTQRVLVSRRDERRAQRVIGHRLAQLALRGRHGCRPNRGFRAVAARGLTQRPQRLGRGERGCG